MARKADDSLAIRLSLVTTALFLLNEAAILFWKPSVLYAPIRVALIPASAAISMVVGALEVLTGRGGRRISGACAVLIAALVWAFQWLTSAFLSDYFW
ncbi:MAG TPA: hypothetical protein VK540_18525 [Polyangiaceae bacterium]|nr:hypothetical protein [Polyangiaceae bacterium]